jgi:predicted Rossmann fold flavoprotein
LNGEELDLAIVGAGAAGLTAAIFARRRARELAADIRIATVDGAAKIGAKILISGGGRCNLTHHTVAADDFNGASRNAIARILRTFSVEQTSAFFRDLGVELKREETGKLFPTTDRARTVLDALLSESGDVRPGCRVTAIRPAFVIDTASGQLRSRAVVVATGGRSIPKTGSDGAGYDMVRALGHSVSAVWPGLVPLVLPRGHWLTSLSGVSLDVELALARPGGRILRRERGSMLFTHFGLSGPVVLDMSRHWIAAGNGALAANLLPGLEFAEVESMLAARPRTTMQAILEAHLPPRLADAVLIREARVEPSRRGAQLTREERRRIAHAVTALPLPVAGDRGFDYAEVTAGGVPLDEIDPRTMESRKCPGLYLCGEILDVDGRIGGFNFQWAWASGRLAGISAVDAIVES